MRILAVEMVGDNDDAQMVRRDRKPLDEHAVDLHRAQGDADPPVWLVEFVRAYLESAIQPCVHTGRDTETQQAVGESSWGEERVSLGWQTHLLQVMHARPGPDGDARGRIAVVPRVRGEEAD